ncbi:MAG: PilZ domain-containing protein [Candidatus Acidiferrum sp.]
MSLLPPRDGDSSTPDKSDRRAHPRRPVSPRLYVVLSGANSDGVLYDVSEGGAALDILGSQPDGEYIVVDFEMAEIGRQFEAKARITWRDEAGKKVGIHFVDLPEASRTQLKEWLLKKMSLEDAAQSALIQDSAREVASSAPQLRPGLRAPTTDAGNNFAGDRPRESGSSGDQLVQNLIESFSKRQTGSYASPLKTSLTDMFASKEFSLSRWNSRSWVALIVAACLAVFVVLGVLAYRSPARNVGINVSKVGQLPEASAGAEAAGDSTHRGEVSSAVFADSGNGTAHGVDLPSPGVPPPVSSSLSKTTAGQPCADLGSPSDKIRIYLWSEKETPAAITAAYATHLKAVLDVRMVNQAPYDLVLYVNGAAAGLKSPEAGFIWSSRVFRPWYCGQALGLLEQTQVNESLHYVEGANLDRHVQSEVAYLILHTFEGIRREHSKVQ